MNSQTDLEPTAKKIIGVVVALVALVAVLLIFGII